MKHIIPGLILLLSLAVNGQSIITIADADLGSGQNYNWTKENIYLLDGYVFLEENSILEIEAGTVIKGKEIPSTGDVASALVITRGAKIIAKGTADEPIIFTSEFDDTTDPFDKFETDRGEWGGLVILGYGIIGDETSEAQVEGFGLQNDPRVLYGGSNNADNSGELTYVSIRHGGSVLADGDEINGLTLGAVGSGTTIHHIEVFANDDDGIEWFGGAAEVKYAAVSFCADDPFDWDNGYKGKGQFWFGLQGVDDGGNGGEHDGAVPDDNDLYADPVVYNATYIGMGADNTNDNSSEYGILFRDGTAGDYANSIITDFSFFALQVEDTNIPNDSRDKLERGELTLKNNIWFGFGEGSELVPADNPNSILGVTNVSADNGQWLVNHLISNGNTLENPMINGISRTGDGGLDPRVSPESPAFDDVLGAPADDFFTTVDFKGAFDSDATWLKGWTALSEYEILDNDVPFVEEYNSLPTSARDRGFGSENYLDGLPYVFPNPVGGNQFSLAFNLKENADVTINLLNHLGQVITVPAFRQHFFDGENQLGVNVEKLPEGIYFYSIQVKNGSPLIGKIGILR